MLIHESRVFELQVETKFEVWDPRTFFFVTIKVALKKKNKKVTASMTHIKLN